ncbi:MAG: pantetheine-phosphate adenylyltransferase, partial [Gammaproteobacteria bacterium]|nr:pantetheine-phosphate adenylyltransferase [Gammaproteobacteria bacterium]
MSRLIIYPGTFDPITLGHQDLVERATSLFDKVIVAVAGDTGKKPLFSFEERIELCKEVLNGVDGIEVTGFKGLLATYAKERKAVAYLRGLRAVSDFEYEFQLALMNRRLNREVQTVFLMTGLRWIFTSSSIIKEAAQFGGDIET